MIFKKNLKCLVKPKPISDKPNIIFVFVDDLGSADVGYAGSDILTPSINRLARSGECYYTQFFISAPL